METKMKRYGYSFDCNAYKVISEIIEWSGILSKYMERNEYNKMLVDIYYYEMLNVVFIFFNNF